MCWSFETLLHLTRRGVVFLSVSQTRREGNFSSVDPCKTLQTDSLGPRLKRQSWRMCASWGSVHEYTVLSRQTVCHRQSLRYCWGSGHCPLQTDCPSQTATALLSDFPGPSVVDQRTKLLFVMKTSLKLLSQTVLKQQ